MAKMVKKQFVVIGLGQFGTSLCKSLFEEGADVLAIDIDQEKINDISDFCTQAICADASDERVLDRLGINNMDVAIICLGTHLEASIFITLMCKQLGIPQVISKATDEKHKQVLSKIGADMVIVPEEDMGEKLAASLTRPNMIEVLSLTDDFRIVEIKTPEKWVKKSITELDLRNAERVTLILIKRGEQVIVTPEGKCVLESDDILVMAGSIADTNRVSAKSTKSVIE